MDTKEQIIAIVFGNKKMFFKAALISVREADTQSTSELEEIPDGQVKEYYADLCMEKTYKNGKLKKSLTLTGRTERTFSSISDKNEPNAALFAQGKTFIRNLRQRLFFIDGEQIGAQELDEAGRVLSVQGKAFSGEAKEFYPNGNVKREASFKNGLPCGSVKTYDKEGRLISQEEYKNGLRDGKAKRFNFIHNIPTEEQLSYKDGFLNGTRKIFGPDGKLLMSEEYRAGKRDGEVKHFNSEGSMEVKAEYKNGKKHGKRIFYYDNGNIMHEETFSGGMLQGERKTYAKNGRLTLTENYKDNLLCGQRTAFDTEGKELRKELYENGKLINKEDK
ncbi:MAG: toxin-antitoxin system YwqK family antitoxin [Elusimicrobiaceae bacterium]